LITGSFKILKQDWFEGCLEGGKVLGFFPANHVQLITNDQKTPPQKGKGDSIEKKMQDSKLDEKKPGSGPGSVPGTPGVMSNDDSSDEEADVPPGWHIVHTSDNVMYYWNEETGETCWELPGSQEKVCINLRDAEILLIWNSLLINITILP
jgi:WW domain